MKVLLVEDDDIIADAIVKTINRTEFRVEHVGTLEDATTALSCAEFELIVLDLGLPDGDGLSFLRSLRDSSQHFPVLVLTARDRPRERVLGLDLGADDYLAKPFDMNELIARMRAIKRRSVGRSSNSIVYGSLQLFPEHIRVLMSGEQIPLPVSQFRLLQYLLEAQGRVRTKRQIIDALYSWDQDVEDNTIEVYVSQLRKSLWADVIKTVRGIGYTVPLLNGTQ